MNAEDPRQIWRSSLVAMRNSLLGTYEITTTAEEQEKFLQCWTPGEPRYIVFSDYKRNEGLRRIRDILDVIDEGIRKIDECEIREAARVFHKTVEQVALFSRVAQILEHFREQLESWQSTRNRMATRQEKTTTLGY